MTVCPAAFLALLSHPTFSVAAAAAWLSISVFWLLLSRCLGCAVNGGCMVLAAAGAALSRLFAAQQALYCPSSRLVRLRALGSAALIALLPSPSPCNCEDEGAELS